MTKMQPKRRQQPQNLLKCTKYEWNLKNKENAHKTSENILDFLHFGGILVSFKFLLEDLRAFYSF